MTTYIKLTTGEFPRYEGDIRLEHPEIREDQTGETFPCPSDYAPVEIMTAPKIDLKTQTTELLPPQKIHGVWLAFWSDVRLLTQQELDNNAAIAAYQKSLDQNAGYVSPINFDLDASGGVPNVVG